MPTVYCYPVKLTIADLIRAKKHMLTDSVQPYNKPIIDLACSVCTVKYQTSVFCMDLAPSIARSILKNLGLIFRSTDLTLGQ
jgi:hypothetical protein